MMNDDQCHCLLFGCHVAVSDWHPDSILEGCGAGGELTHVMLIIACVCFWVLAIVCEPWWIVVVGFGWQ